MKASISESELYCLSENGWYMSHTSISSMLCLTK